MDYLAPLVGTGDPFGIMDNFDTDRAARHVAELFGTPPDYLRPEPDVAEARAGRNRAADRASGESQAVRMTTQMAEVARTLAAAHTDRPSVLTELWSLLGPRLASGNTAPADTTAPHGATAPDATAPDTTSPDATGQPQPKSPTEADHAV
jgi:hypothetical protein